MSSPLPTENRFCFLAIVRDESRVIERCLTSVKDIATSYLICDTGSKDDTISKIEVFMAGAGIPGEVITREWRSYGENKSELLKVFRAHPVVGDAKYICWLDADEVFITNPKVDTSYPTKEDADKLYGYLEKRTENVYRIKTIYGLLTYVRWQFARNNQLYEWKLPYQEYFAGTVSHVDHDLDLSLWNFSRHEGNSSNDPDITKKRIEMSERWMERNPDDPSMDRMIFYLAEAYTSIDPNKAVELYKRRLEMGGYYQEKYISMLKIAELVEPQYKLMYWALAQDMVPERLEAYYDMFIYYYSRGNHRKAAAIFFAAPSSRVPPAGLFIKHQIYDYLFDMNGSVSLYYTGEYKKAYEVCASLLARKTYPPTEAAQVEKNMSYFREKYIPLVAQNTLVDNVNASSPLPSFVVIDNFYDNPMEIRENALKMTYSVKGNYPGARTESTATDADRKRFETIIGRAITYWPTQYNGSFQYTTKDNKSWIHRDPTNFSVVVYLTPDPPVNGGTVLYRHRETKLERVVEKSAEDVRLNNDGNDESLWEVVDRVGNKFNRAIIFQGGLSHKSDFYFGDDISNGRLFQTFFFNVEGRKY